MPAKNATTMSVRETGALLGLKKTESYYLLRKNYFEAIVINKQIRMVIKSFEEWYANQDRYRKVDGTEPGTVLRTKSLSRTDIGVMLDLDPDSVSDLIKKVKLPTFWHNGKLRVPCDTYDRWYASQTQYLNAEDREKNKAAYVTPGTIRKIHNVLRSAMTQAEKWELLDRNPARLATVPKLAPNHREIWDAQTLFKAIESCQDDRLKLCLNLSFACSLRLGELLALTWDCVDISEESIRAGKASVFVNKELQRVNKKIMKTLDSKDVIRVFPEAGPWNKTVLVLKTPKTLTSVRKVFLPKTVAEMLITWKQEQDVTKKALGSEYVDYDLVIAGPMGMPTEGSRIRKAMQDLIV